MVMDCKTSMHVNVPYKLFCKFGAHVTTYSEYKILSRCHDYHVKDWGSNSNHNVYIPSLYFFLLHDSLLTVYIT